MVALKRLVPAAGLLAVTVLAGCKDSISPDTVNASTLSSSITGVTSIFQNNAAFQSMATLSALFPRYAATASLRATLPAAPAAPAAPGVLAERADAARRLVASLTANPQALFPANVLGKTLEWDATTHSYKPGNQPGASAAGIRILIYSVNSVTGEPVVPLQQLGYVDLIDKSSPQNNKLGVILTLGSTTIADYDITAVIATNSATIGAAGYIRNPTGTGRVDFGFTNALSQTTISSTSQLTGDDGTEIHAGLTITPNNATLTCSVSKGGNTIELTAGGDSTITGTVKFNGTTVATISGSGDPPIFTGANGRQLKPEEVVALTDIFGRALDVVGKLADVVFKPGDVVFH